MQKHKEYVRSAVVRVTMCHSRFYIMANDLSDAMHAIVDTLDTMQSASEICYSILHSAHTEHDTQQRVIMMFILIYSVVTLQLHCINSNILKRNTTTTALATCRLLTRCQAHIDSVCISLRLTVAAPPQRLEITHEQHTQTYTACTLNSISV